MADLFSMKSPLMIRYPDGQKRIMVEYFKHAEGLLFFEAFWKQGDDSAIHLVKGEYKGEGPWKVGDCVISVLACHGSEPELASLFSEWQTYLQMSPESYPPEKEIQKIAIAHGAIV